jgi:hypothetical protein
MRLKLEYELGLVDAIQAPLRFLPETLLYRQFYGETVIVVDF